MISKKEKEKIIKDIESDSTITDYFLGKKYKHSPHSIADIRKEHEAQKMEAKKEEEKEELKQKELEQEAGDVNVDDLHDMGTQMEYEKEIAPTRAQIEHAKVKKHSERLADELEKKLDEDEKDIVRGKQLREKEAKQTIIDEYQKDVIDKQFNPKYLQEGSHWYTQEMLNAYVVPRDKKIEDLEGQINQINMDHAAELKQLKANHASELKQLKTRYETELTQEKARGVLGFYCTWCNTYVQLEPNTDIFNLFLTFLNYIGVLCPDCSYRSGLGALFQSKALLDFSQGFNHERNEKMMLEYIIQHKNTG